MAARERKLSRVHKNTFCWAQKKYTHCRAHRKAAANSLFRPIYERDCDTFVCVCVRGRVALCVSGESEKRDTRVATGQ
jgi:hypothetical protein